MNEEVREIYIELWKLCAETDCPLRHRYRLLRESFERVAREQMQNVSLQSTDLAARINYLSAQFSLKDWCKNALHTFRLTSNEVMNHRKSPLLDEFLRDVRSVAEAYQGIFEAPIPKELEELLPKKIWKTSMKRGKIVIFPLFYITLKDL